MRISDWSSDVCSSDLGRPRTGQAQAHIVARRGQLRSIHRMATGDVPEDARGFGHRLGRLVGLHRGARREHLRTTATADTTTGAIRPTLRSEEHTSELQSLMRISYAVFCLKKKKTEN